MNIPRSRVAEWTNGRWGGVEARKHAWQVTAQLAERSTSQVGWLNEEQVVALKTAKVLSLNTERRGA